MITFDKVELNELKLGEDGIYSFELKQYLDGKEVPGTKKLTARITSDQAEILTPEVKLKKGAEVQFKATQQNVDIFIDVKDQDIEIFSFSLDQNDELEESKQDVDEFSEETNGDLLEKEEDSLEENLDTLNEDLQRFKIFNLSKIDFEFIFTSQIREILDDNITSEEARKIYNKTLNAKSALFLRDTNTNTFYWVYKDKVLQNTNINKLALDVNEYIDSVVVD